MVPGPDAYFYLGIAANDTQMQITIEDNAAPFDVP